MITTLVTGADGLLAHALKILAAKDFDFSFLSRREFDLSSPDQMGAQLDALRPAVVINTAAYNLVEKCEQERELSWAVNATAPETLAKLCAARKIRLVHYGTDYVFDGAKKSPYAETDAANPVNHYGAGKFAGEQAVLAASPENLVLRTSWVFGAHPTQAKSYVHTALRLAAGGGEMKATDDQVASPTFAGDLASWTVELLRLNARGLFHAVNDEGVSRYDWTLAILDEAVKSGALAQAPRVQPVPSSFFKSTMKRPGYSVLSNAKLAKTLGHEAGSWRAGLRKMLAHGGAR